MPSEGVGFLLRIGSQRGLSVSPRFARHAMTETPLAQRSPKSARLPRRQVLPEPSSSLRVVVMGAAGVGKTSLVKHLRQADKPKLRSTKSAPTRKTSICEVTHVEFTENDQVLQLDLLDSSGYDGFPVMMELAIQQAQAFILVCAADNDASFERIKELRQDIIRIKQEQGVRYFPMVVVVNKTDLPPAPTSLSLAYAELAVLCDWGDSGFTKCTISGQDNSREILRELLRQVNTLQSRRALALQLLTGKIQRRKTMPRSAKLSERNRAQSPVGKNLSLPVDFENQPYASAASSPRSRPGSFRSRRDSPKLANSLPAEFELDGFKFRKNSPVPVDVHQSDQSPSSPIIRHSTL